MFDNVWEKRPLCRRSSVASFGCIEIDCPSAMESARNRVAASWRGVSRTNCLTLHFAASLDFGSPDIPDCVLGWTSCLCFDIVLYLDYGLDSCFLMSHFHGFVRSDCLMFPVCLDVSKLLQFVFSALLG